MKNPKIENPQIGSFVILNMDGQNIPSLVVDVFDDLRVNLCYVMPELITREWYGLEVDFANNKVPHKTVKGDSDHYWMFAFEQEDVEIIGIVSQDHREEFSRSVAELLNALRNDDPSKAIDKLFGLCIPASEALVKSSHIQTDRNDMNNGYEVGVFDLINAIIGYGSREYFNKTETLMVLPGIALSPSGYKVNNPAAEMSVEAEPCEGP